MKLNLDTATQSELLDLLAPLMEDEKARRGLLQLALGLGAPVLRNIKWTGPVQLFVLGLIGTLADYGEIEPGKQALWALLEVLHEGEHVGVDRQDRIKRLEPILNPRPEPPAEPPPPDQAAPDTTPRPRRAPLHLRVFLASPSDVSAERALARKVLHDLAYDPLLRGQMTLEPVAWDDPSGNTPLLATMTPQAAIDEGLAKPSECDIVVVIFWARMGTPLPREYTKPDGSPYVSGAEWEYEDAIRGHGDHGKPEVLVYRRAEEPRFSPADAEFMQKYEQWQRVEAFFEGFRDPDGTIRRGYNTYAAAGDFERVFKNHLRALIKRLIDAAPRPPTGDGAPVPSEPPLWEGPPFPGLRAFDADDASIFFGRGRETDDLVAKLAEPHRRFIVVVGASGAGKSSLVAAGLLPRLHANEIEGSKDWLCVRITPGELGPNPFVVLADRLRAQLENEPRSALELAGQLAATPAALDELAGSILEGEPDWAQLLLFVDQFEELFTLAGPEHRGPFIEMLAAAAEAERLRIVATIRADFYARCLEWPKLTALMRAGSYPLAAPEFGALFEMITGPAARAGLTLEDGLALRILEDTGKEPGALALMAFALAELYEAREPNGLLTHAAYERFGGVKGAIAKRAEDTFAALEADVQAELPTVFRELVEVDERGVVTRQRAKIGRAAASDTAGEFITALVDARLLVTSRAEGDEPVVEAAHEALLEAWPRLAGWIGDTREDLHLLRQLRLAAREWKLSERAESHLWPHERLVSVHAMMERLQPDLDEVEQAFVRPELERLMDEINDPATTHQRRWIIGDRLAEIGDTRPGVGLNKDGVPDIAWSDVPAGKITLERGHGTFSVQPFKIAMYPITYIQYRAFLEAADGYADPTWWDEPAKREEQPGQQYRRVANRPAEKVSWYDAVAFCRWLSAKLGCEIRLPTEWEWQQAATGGDPANRYPWGPQWDSRFANTDESGLSRTTAVGMYPRGASPVGAVDMSGNVWEWCVNEYDRPARTTIEGDSHRVVRGGSWRYFPDLARAAYRDGSPPIDRSNFIGFRVVVSSPISVNH